ncbi:3-ketosphinganine reductase-like protein [Zopfia rhizophila CBS 207.26]|uniref:3-dehydrosphinganine reductase n=1 Tax=Zopfia rhizophila CBS 207.26 TaxID=1314779 RepID=A0A6A6DWB2_9PEZI|nr:3-ketosphinganine reductase-like protein [Zopfia rhizophila CBS 207.26]
MALAYLWASVCLLTLLGILSVHIMGFLEQRNKFQVEGRTVLLTGGSQGMGREVAKLLARRGANVIIVARDLKKLQAALEYVKAAAKDLSTQRFHVISADVTSESENARVISEATTWNNGRVPEIVWANAGAAKPGLFVETSVETMRKQMDINYWAAVYLAHQILKAWLYPSTPYPAASPNSKGRIKSEPPRHFIMTSSSAAFAGVAGYSPYSPAKTALRGLADALRNEILLYNGARRSPNTTKQSPTPFDIHIQTIYPGTIQSPGLEIENSSKHPVTHILESSDPVQTELEAATAAIQGLENGNYMTPTNWLGGLMRFGALGGSPKDNIIKDMLGQWLSSIVWLFVSPDLEAKVWGWGKKEGMPELKAEAK